MHGQGLRDNNCEEKMADDKHTVTYDLLSHTHFPSVSADIEVSATPEELQQFEQSGYLVREGLFSGEALVALQDALDRLEERESSPFQDPKTGKKSWGWIPRHLMDKDPAFLDLLKFQPTLSVARAMMGPLVRLRGLSARISYPASTPQQTPWHQHMRVITDPLPPWFSRPHCIDVLIYLDDLNDDTGPVAIVPGSHNWLDRAPPHDVYESVDGELEVRVEAGGGVMIHGNLWHRGMPTLRAKRRMLILSYTPTWLRKSPHGGPQPEDGLTQDVLDGEDEEARILLGKGGYT